jgi:Arc/MetJ family transcription regulator
MKMTMHIDEALLAEVMTATGAASKTEAVDMALRKVARKFRQRERWRTGLGMSAEEIRAGFDPDLAASIHAPEKGIALLAEEPSEYGAKHSG